MFVHLLLLGIFLHFERSKPLHPWLHALLLGCLLGVLVLFRFEALAFALFVMGLAWRTSGLEFVWKVSIVLLLLLSPRIVRNVLVLSALYFPPAWASTRTAATIPRPSARGRIRSSPNFFRRLRDLSLR